MHRALFDTHTHKDTHCGRACAVGARQSGLGPLGVRSPDARSHEPVRSGEVRARSHPFPEKGGASSPRVATQEADVHIPVEAKSNPQNSVWCKRRLQPRPG